MRIVAVVQARMGSTRLPGKVMMDINGKPMIQHVMERVMAAKEVDEVVLATTGNIEDDVLVELAKDKWWVYQGEPVDVLARFHGAAECHDADVIVRITGDCPLIDPWVIDEAVKGWRHMGSLVVTTSPTEPTPYPDGMDVEVFDMALLEWAWKESTEREHVTAWMRHNCPIPGPFMVAVRGQPPNFSFDTRKLSVDTMEDLEFVREIHKALGPEIFGIKEIAEHLKEVVV